MAFWIGCAVIYGVFILLIFSIFYVGSRADDDMERIMRDIEEKKE